MQHASDIGREGKCWL